MPIPDENGRWRNGHARRMELLCQFAVPFLCPVPTRRGGDTEFFAHLSNVRGGCAYPLNGDGGAAA